MAYADQFLFEGYLRIENVWIDDKDVNLCLIMSASRNVQDWWELKQGVLSLQSV